MGSKGSKSKSTREKQQLRVEALLAARIAALDASGVKEADRRDDPVFRKLRAEAKKAKRRLTAMVERDALVQKAIADRASRAAEKAAEKAAQKAGAPAPGKAGEKKKAGKKAKAEGADEEPKPKKAPKGKPEAAPEEAPKEE